MIKAIQKVVRQFNWNSAVGISVTRQARSARANCSILSDVTTVAQLFFLTGPWRRRRAGRERPRLLISARHACAGNLTASSRLCPRRAPSSPQVWRALGGRDAARTLVAALPSCKGQVATMIHTEAAAHCEMAYGAGLGRMGRVLTVTVGAGLGAVLYRDGARTPTDLSHLTWTFAGELTRVAEAGGWAGGSYTPVEPFPEGVAAGQLQGGWGAYVALLDKFISKVLRAGWKPFDAGFFRCARATAWPGSLGLCSLSAAPRPPDCFSKVLKSTEAECVILLPTGDATAVPWATGVLPHLVTGARGPAPSSRD